MSIAFSDVPIHLEFGSEEQETIKQALLHHSLNEPDASEELAEKITDKTTVSHRDAECIRLDLEHYSSVLGEDVYAIIGKIINGLRAAGLEPLTDAQ